ncbi:MAG: hypothetical protein NC048_07025 [Bacteroides sp.]|nr:hypothetical protein [Bacteroides sp.]
MFILIAVIVVLCGIGGYIWQHGDHYFRNAIFKALVENKWPVVKPVETELGLRFRILDYYLGFWLPAAVFGKVFGLEAGFFFQFLWASLGLFLIWYHLCRFIGKYSLWILVAFVFFGGLDLLGYFILDCGRYRLFFEMDLEVWSFSRGEWLAYVSFFNHMRGAFNQIFYAAPIFLVLLQEKTNRNLVFLWGCALLCCTIPFVGMIPFLIYRIWRNGKRYGDLISFQNVAGGAVVGLVSFSYIIGNPSGGALGWFHFGFLQSVLIFLLFVLLEAGVFLALVYRRNKGVLFWITAAVLVLLPFTAMNNGQMPDFCMRASIPAFLVLFAMYVKAWVGAKEQRRKGELWILSVVFVLSTAAPACNLYQIMQGTCKKHGCERRIAQEEEIMRHGNFSGWTDECPFYRLFAKKQEVQPEI